jgi:hypothetical protein
MRSDLHYLELTELARRIHARESLAGGGNDSAACAHREAGRPAQELRVRDGRGSAGARRLCLSDRDRLAPQASDLNNRGKGRLSDAIAMLPAAH